MQNLPIKFPNKEGILVLTPTLLKFMSLFLNKFKLGFCSDTYLPFGPNSRFLLFFFWRSSLRENLWQKLIFCNNRKNSFRHRMFIIFCTMHIKFWYLQERNKRLTDAWLSWAIGCWEMSFTTHKTSTKLAQWFLMM